MASLRELAGLAPLRSARVVNRVDLSRAVESGVLDVWGKL